MINYLLPEERPLRILQVCPRYFPFVDSVQDHTYQLSRRLAAAGVSVTILTSNPEGKLPAEEESGNVRIKRVRSYPTGKDYTFAPDIYPIVAHGRWDVVHIQSCHDLIAPTAMLAALKSDTPYIVTLHGRSGQASQAHAALRSLYWQMLRPLLARARRLISTARFEQHFFGERLGLPASTFSYIPTGGDLPTLRAPMVPSTNQPLLVSIGPLKHDKGHQRVIAALPHVLRQRPNVRLWIVGSGPYDAELRSLAKRLGVADRVSIHSVPPDDRLRLAIEISNASLVLSLSEHESNSMAILEAVALGRSVLVANAPYLNDLAADGLARAISLHYGSEQLAAAIVDQLDRPHRPQRMRLGTWDECSSRVLTLYEDIAGPRRQPVEIELAVGAM